VNAVSRIDPDDVESGFWALLASHPQAGVTAIAAHGLFVPLPATIVVPGHPVVGARSALDLVESEHRVGVIDAWDRARDLGAALVQVRLRGGQDAALYFFDTRARHGVLMGVLVANGEVGPRGAEVTIDIAPRVSVQRKNDIAVFTDVDDATTKMLGWKRDEIVGHASLEFVHPDDHDRAIESWMDMLSNPGEKRRARLRYRRADGTWMWLELTNENFLGDPHEPCVLTESLDISDEMAAHEAVRVREQLLRRVAETVPLGLLQIDRLGNVLYANERLYEILGLPKLDESTPPFTNILADDRDRLDHALEMLMVDGADRDLEVEVDTRRRTDNRLCHLRLRALNDLDGSLGGAIVCVEDITDRARSRAELERRATYDTLTGCLNRASVLHHLETFVAEPPAVGVIFLDLDGFKLINDTHGHRTGDRVLVEAARRVQQCIRDTDALGRLGGDEFLVVCTDACDLAAVVQIATRIADIFAIPVDLADGSVAIRASIGIALAHGSSTTSESLIADADAAMYVAKRNGDGRPVACEPSAPPA
jgi:diguanylate cyclase (GGDEF)-like protein/PAS domain S-box-containing protein